MVKRLIPCWFRKKKKTKTHPNFHMHAFLTIGLIDHVGDKKFAFNL